MDIKLARENYFARDGTGNNRPNNLASSGMKPPSAIRRGYHHIAPEWFPRLPWNIRASARYRQPPGDTLHRTTLTGHLTGSDKTRRCTYQPTPSQCSH